MNYYDFKRYKFSTVTKKFSTLIYSFLKFFKLRNFKSINFRKFYKYLDIKSFYKNFNINNYSIYRNKKDVFFNSRFYLFHIPVAIIFFGFLYLLIPTFFSYDRSAIEDFICRDKNIKCTIKGKVGYSIYPSPRIKINDLIIYSSFSKKKPLISVNNVTIKLSIQNLLAKEKHKFKKIILKNYETNINLKNIKKHKNIFENKTNLIPISFLKGDILFFDESKYVATINNASIKLKFPNKNLEANLKGIFLNDNIKINLDTGQIDGERFNEIILKMSALNLFSKLTFFNNEKSKDKTNGNFLVKKDKNKISGIFDYKDKKLLIKKSNLRNSFIDGKLEGEIIFLPYFNFDLAVGLNSLNFTRLYNYFLSLSENEKKRLFKINEKFNGKLSLYADKIYSSYNIVESFESRVQFKNTNILIEQLLFNLGKLGAADLVGRISKDKKFTNFKFQSNIFVDNKKKFLSKFGIFNKKDLPLSFYISANFDFDNLKTNFYEISDGEDLNNEDVNFIEKEFNNQMLEEGYETLFRFPKFKEFIKSISSEIN